ncbi:MAG: threonyl-tRNA synthetase editing domain-containing protein [Candidatus Micrarchaeota archaeon]|nr:threonyl-tRNA synthetase editing domain-containing protein [Candidatus Micrarchaeota archaeon]
MKLLYIHSKNLIIEAGVPGKTPSQRRRAEAKMRGKFGSLLRELNERTDVVINSKNALLTFVCVEKGDEGVDLDRVKTDILRSSALIGVSEIVIGAFAHLSNNVATAELARDIIDELANCVNARILNDFIDKVDMGETKIKIPKIYVYPFGWDKSIKLNIPLHHYNFSFRSFEPLLTTP